MEADTVTLQEDFVLLRVREYLNGGNPVDMAKSPMTRLKRHFNGPKNLLAKEF